MEIPVGRPTEPATGIRGVVLDVTGTLVKGIAGWEAFEGVPRAVQQLRERGLRLLILSNNPWDTPADLARFLNGAGIQAREEEVLTSGALAARYVGERFPGGRALVLGHAGRGNDGLRPSLAQRGVTVVDEPPADVVLVSGWSDRIPAACQAIWQNPDAPLLTMTLARRLPVGPGRFALGGGPAAQAIAWATSKEPIVMGKPSLTAAEAALRALDLPGEAIVVVGDLLNEDVGLGRRMGAHTALIVGGATSAQAVAAAPAEAQPDTAIAHLGELLPWLDELERAR
jgi:HAD superfamily hydrolase (TIGR01450 family)